MYAMFLYRIEMYIVGGFLDSRNISEDVFMQILRKYIFVILETLKAWFILAQLKILSAILCF